MATMAKTKIDEGNRSKVPVFTPLQVPTWQLLIKTHLMRYQSDYVLFEDPPELDEDELESFRTEEGKESKDSLKYLRIMREKQEKYDKDNALAYSLLVESISGHDGAMLLVMAEPDNDSAKRLYEEVVRKFKLSGTKILQSELSKFHQLEMGPSETGSAFIDRLTAAKIRLRQLDCVEATTDVQMVERLLGAMAKSKRYSGLVQTLRLAEELSWDKAVEQIMIYDHYQDAEPIAKPAVAHLAKTKFKRGDNRPQCHLPSMRI